MFSDIQLEVIYKAMNENARIVNGLIIEEKTTLHKQIVIKSICGKKNTMNRFMSLDCALNIIVFLRSKLVYNGWIFQVMNYTPF